jgi:hypothetical protein
MLFEQTHVTRDVIVMPIRTVCLEIKKPVSFRLRVFSSAYLRGKPNTRARQTLPTSVTSRVSLRMEFQLRTSRYRLSRDMPGRSTRC